MVLFGWFGDNVGWFVFFGVVGLLVKFVSCVINWWC